MHRISFVGLEHTDSGRNINEAYVRNQASGPTGVMPHHHNLVAEDRHQVLRNDSTVYVTSTATVAISW